MDWIESFFHVSPDAGSGVTEAVLFGAALLAIAVGVAATSCFDRWRAVATALVRRVRRAP